MVATQTASSPKPIDPRKSPWPEIRKARIQKLLPQAMRLAGIDAWVVICRHNNDPLALYVGGENAGSTAAFMFFLKGDRVESIAVYPWEDAAALKDVGLHDQVIEFEGYEDVWQLVAQQVKAADPHKIGVNCSSHGIADGLSWTQRMALEKAMGPKLASRLASSEDVVAEWLSVKLPEEIEIMRQAAELTVQLQIEAYERVVPGKTRDCDVAHYVKERMAELGVEDGWTPSFNPMVVSGTGRGHWPATQKVIQPGDFVVIDLGIKVYGIWCTDLQRFAYVLAPGQTGPPPQDLKRWENAKKGSRVVLTAMKPGVRGYDIDKAQREWMQKAGSLPVRWNTGHPVGYWAVYIGPRLAGAQREAPPSGDMLRVLRPGQTFSFDGFFSWEVKGEGGRAEKLISVEEMAVVTKDGAEYLISPQEELVLIPSS